MKAWEFLPLEPPSRSGVRRHEAHEKMIASLAEHQMSPRLIADPARASEMVSEQSAPIQPALNVEIWRVTHGR